MICLGTTPPPPPPITTGCTVTKLLYPLRYEGVVTKMVGQDCFIMWTAFTNVSNNSVVQWGQTVTAKQKIERSSKSREEQAEGWGWLGINPTGQTSLKTTYTKGQLAMKEVEEILNQVVKELVKKQSQMFYIGFHRLEIVSLENGLLGVNVVRLVVVVHKVPLDQFYILLSLVEDLAHQQLNIKLALKSHV